MKNGLMYLLVGLIAVTFSTLGFAMEKKKGDHDEGHIKGEITKIDGEMVTVKDEHGEEHMLHVDKSTKKKGEIKTGAHVEAEATDSGHAKSITAHAEEKESH